MQYLNGLMHSNVIDRKEIFHVNDKMGIFFIKAKGRFELHFVICIVVEYD